MYLKEIISILKNKISPDIYVLDKEFYGIQYGTPNLNKIIKNVMLTLDLNLNCIHYAIMNKINMIISYRGLIFKPLYYFDPYIIKKLSLLSKAPIVILVLNSSFIAAENGISDTIMEALYCELEKTFDIIKSNGIKVPIGRICIPKSCPAFHKAFNMQQLLQRIKDYFEVQNIAYVGELTKEINKICIIGRKLESLRFLEQVILDGCDCVIASDINHDQATFAKDMDIALVKIPYYESEISAMRRLTNILSLEYPMDKILLYESKNPINYY